jgi:hypothetical protein
MNPNATQQIETAAARYRPQHFVIDIPGIGPNLGDFQEGSISLNDRVFILQRITHAIVAWSDWTAHPVGWGIAAYNQDSMYRLDWSINNQQRFWKGTLPPLAMIAHGSAQAGYWLDLPAPVALNGLETIHLKVINAILRTAGQLFTVQTIFHGLERVDR